MQMAPKVCWGAICSREEISCADAAIVGRTGWLESSALNKLGLSTQVPTRLVYITDGPPRQLKLGKLEIKFKATSHKKLATTGKISALVIQALEELDLNNIDESRTARIRQLLLTEDPKKLKHDLTLAPARIHDYIVKLLNEK